MIAFHGSFRRSAKSAAFTLVEMLVVMAIIGILAGMILPALAKAREQGRRVRCMSNLGQIHKAMELYSIHNDGYLPSWPSYGINSCTVWDDPATAGDVDYLSYAGDQGGSRNMVFGYGYAHDDTGGCTALKPQERDAAGRVKQNFMPVGLGILVARGDIEDADVFFCPSMRGSATTYFGNTPYQYQDNCLKVLGANDDKLFSGDGRNLAHSLATAAGANMKVAALLSSYAYRNHPFYSRVQPSNWPTHWPTANDPAAHPWNGWDSDEGIDGDLGTSDRLSTLATGGHFVAEWDPLTNPNGTGQGLESVKPNLKAQYMTPPFRTSRALGDRAIISDSFDYASPTIADTFSDAGGMARFHHGTGYNVLFGDGHGKWNDDNQQVIQKWRHWANPSPTLMPDNKTMLYIDNLTISSSSSQRVWNVFDRTSGIDVTN